MTEPFPPPAPPLITPTDLRRTIRPLRLIFWGVLCCIFNFSFSTTTNGSGFRFEFPGHALGLILIIIGLFRLAPLPVSRLYTFVLRLAQVVAALALVDAVRKHIILPDQPPMVDNFFAFVGWASIIAAVLFCVAMIWLCRTAGFPGPARSWRTTTLLLIIVYLFSLVFAYGAAILVAHTNLSPKLLSLLGWLMFLAWLIPLIHFYVSTSRMKRAADEALEADPLPVAFESPQPSNAGAVITIVLSVLVGLAMPPIGAQVMSTVTAHHLAIPGLRSQRLEDGLTKLWGKSLATASDPTVDISVGSNSFGEARVVAIRHLTDPAILERGRTVGSSSSEPLAGLLSDVRVDSSFPADETKSGLWIDGVKKPFLKPLTVIYVSDKYPATDVPIPDPDRKAFLQDVEQMEPNVMIEKWIRPRLPPANGM